MDGMVRDPYSMAVKLYCTVTARAALTCDYTMGTNFHNHNCNCTVNARIRVGPLNVPRRDFVVPVSSLVCIGQQRTERSEYHQYLLALARL